MIKANHDAVLGGTASPLATAAVLGGQEKYLAKLFDLFNAECQRRNKTHVLLKLSADVSLVGQNRRQPLDDLKVKVRHVLNVEHRGLTAYWILTGYLKHKGSLFLPHEATYAPATACSKELKSIAYQALILKAREVGEAL
jgi:hypothetical protein